MFKVGRTFFISAAFITLHLWIVFSEAEKFPRKRCSFILCEHDTKSVAFSSQIFGLVNVSLSSKKPLRELRWIHEFPFSIYRGTDKKEGTTSELEQFANKKKAVRMKRNKLSWIRQGSNYSEMERPLTVPKTETLRKHYTREILSPATLTRQTSPECYGQERCLNDDLIKENRPQTEDGVHGILSRLPSHPSIEYGQLSLVDFQNLQTSLNHKDNSFTAGKSQFELSSTMHPSQQSDLDAAQKVRMPKETRISGLSNDAEIKSSINSPSIANIFQLRGHNDLIERKEPDLEKILINVMKSNGDKIREIRLPYTSKHKETISKRRLAKSKHKFQGKSSYHPLRLYFIHPSGIWNTTRKKHFSRPRVLKQKKSLPNTRELHRHETGQNESEIYILFNDMVTKHKKASIVATVIVSTILLSGLASSCLFSLRYDSLDEKADNDEEQPMLKKQNDDLQMEDESHDNEMKITEGVDFNESITTEYTGSRTDYMITEVKGSKSTSANLERKCAASFQACLDSSDTAYNKQPSGEDSILSVHSSKSDGNAENKECWDHELIDLLSNVNETIEGEEID